MNASAAIADVRAKGMGPQARGVISGSAFSLASCPLPLAWLPCDFSMNRHKQRGLTRYRKSDGTKIWQWTLGTGRVSG
jgi:hypothetical protein